MKADFKIILTLFFLLLTVAAQDAMGQGAFWRDNFEANGPDLGGGDRNAPNHADTDNGSGPVVCGVSDFFYRTTQTGANAGNGQTAAYTNFNGSNIWRAEDVDGCPGVTNPDQLDFTGIAITGRTNLRFSGLFAARQGGNFDLGEFLNVDFRLTGAAPFTNGLHFLRNGSGNLQLDTFPPDGTPDGAELTEAMAFFEIVLGGTGTTLALRVTTNTSGSGEHAFDFFRVSEVPLMVPVELQSFSVE